MRRFRTDSFNLSDIRIIRNSRNIRNVFNSCFQALRRLIKKRLSHSVPLTTSRSKIFVEMRNSFDLSFNKVRHFSETMGHVSIETNLLAVIELQPKGAEVLR